MTKEPTTVLGWLELGYERLKDPSRWIKGNYEKNGKYCLVGACTVNMARGDAYYALRSAVDRLYPDCAEYTLVYFNDNVATYDMILHVLQAAIWAEGGRKFEPREGETQ